MQQECTQSRRNERNPTSHAHVNSGLPTATWKASRPNADQRPHVAIARSKLQRCKLAVRTAISEVVRTLQNAALVLKVMIFVHSTKDFESLLKLYGIERYSKIP